ncbi:MAG: hypothetical protein IPI66_10040 [Chitinophagaceae bacterium]|nr:hypothetical protein [Chitinophagaceae bacterium]
MPESNYKDIIDGFLSKRLSVDKFIDVFMIQWKADRDNKIEYDVKFQEIIDQVFTASDCYSEKPENTFEISETQLRKEITFLYNSWYS